MIDPYVYEGTDVLKNKFNIRDSRELKIKESDVTFTKLLTLNAGVPRKEFDADYLRAIHRYMLEDLFEWAGEYRTIPMEKEEKVLNGLSVQYTYPTEIERKTEACINLLNQINWEEKGLDQKSELFTKLVAGLWQVHPFRDGNTRAIMAFAFEFAKEHGFDMNKDVFLQNFTYVRDAFVMASIGEYSEPQYLNQRVKTAIELGNSIDKDTDIEFGTDDKQNTDQQHHEKDGDDIR